LPRLEIVPGGEKHACSLTAMTRHFFPYTGFTAKTVRSRLANADNEYYVALREGHCVGFVDLEYSGESAKILGLGVLQEERGKGIGKKLLDHALGKAREKARRIHILVAEDNGSARRLYEDKGFENLGCLDRLINGKTVLLMARDL